MTLLEVLLLIQERQEVISIDRVFNIQTDKYSYNRLDGSWEQKELPPKIIEECKFPPLPIEVPKSKKDK
jgi:hypothetical protein